MKLPSEHLAETDSDKTHDFHRYGDFYDMLILSLYHQNRTIPLRVLEIGASRFGVGSGHAFCMMPEVKEYVGVDIKLLIEPFPNRKGVFIQGDAYTDEMVELLAKHDRFNLIIDDGSHELSDWEFVLNQYSTLLTNPGALVIEDVDYPEAIEDFDLTFVKHAKSGKGGRIAYKLKGYDK